METVRQRRNRLAKKYGARHPEWAGLEYSELGFRLSVELECEGVEPETVEVARQAAERAAKQGAA